MQFLARVAAHFIVALGHEAPDQGDGAQGDRADQHERRAPAEVLAQQGSDRVAEQHGQGQPHHHPGHGPRPLVLGHHARRHHRRDAEVGAVGQAADEAEGDQATERGGEGGSQVAKGIQRHQQQQHVLAQQPGTDDRQCRGADHHPQRIGADGMAHLGLAQLQVAGDIGHQAHDGELAGANGKAAQRHGGFHLRDGSFAWERG
ncbi:hypothetical protein D3C75_793660 [compost metagenome]